MAGKKAEGRPLLRLTRSLTTENLWLYILSLLSKGKRHGYTIADDIGGEFGWSPGFITPYVVLYKLEEDGYIASRSSGRRKYYAITASGRSILRKAKAVIKRTGESL